jgi:hypothetical protein
VQSKVTWDAKAPNLVENGDLLAKGENLQGSIAPCAEENSEGKQDCERKLDHELTFVTRCDGLANNNKGPPDPLILRSNGVLATNRVSPDCITAIAYAPTGDLFVQDAANWPGLLFRR